MEAVDANLRDRYNSVDSRPPGTALSCKYFSLKVVEDRMLVSRISVAAVMLIVSTTISIAQTPIESPNWQGAYAGINGGLLQLNDNGTNFCTTTNAGNYNCGTSTPASDILTTSYLLGGQVGYNYTYGHLVVGLETDFQRSSLSNNHVELLETVFSPQFGPSQFSSAASEKLSWIGTTRARVGFPSGRTLVYATGGLAYAHVDLATETKYNNIADYRGRNSLITTGWTLGGGIEWLLSKHSTVRAEALYYDLGNIAVDGRSPNLPQFVDGRDFQLHGTIVRAALNYKF
jgi:outer membrane immunogenic protein